ncbi:MAG: tetratricopeptide repeat protein, partial [Atribacterota bacterium]
ENYVEKNPQDEIAWFRLAYIHEVRSDAPGVSEWKEAREALEKALVLSPENSVYLLHLGYVYYRIGEIDKAQQTFQAILDREPGNIEVRYYAALNYKKKGEPEKARTELEYILKNEPKESIVYRRAEDEFIKLGGNVE